MRWRPLIALACCQGGRAEVSGVVNVVAGTEDQVLEAHLWGELEPPGGEEGNFVIPPSGARIDWRDVQQVEATTYAYAVLHKDGRVATFGSSLYGGDSSSVASRLQSVRKVYAGPKSFVAITTDFEVVAWGYPDGRTDTSSVATDLVFANWAVSSDGAWAVVRQDESVVTFGLPERGGDSRAEQPRLTEIVSIVGLDGSFAAVSWTGDLAGMWGQIAKALPVVPGTNSTVLDDLPPVFGFLRDVDVPFVVQNKKGVTAVIRTDGLVYASGSPEYGAGVADTQAYVDKVTTLGDVPPGCSNSLHSFVASDGAFCSLCDGEKWQEVLCWGHPDYGARPPLPPFKPASIVPHHRSFCVLERNATHGVFCWGDTLGPDGWFGEGVAEVFAIKAGFAITLLDGSVFLLNLDNPQPAPLSLRGVDGLDKAKMQQGVALVVANEAALFGVDPSNGVFAMGDAKSGADLPGELDGCVIHELHTTGRSALAVLHRPPSPFPVPSPPPGVTPPPAHGEGPAPWVVAVGAGCAAVALIAATWGAIVVRKARQRLALPREADYHLCILGVSETQAQMLVPELSRNGLSAVLCGPNDAEAEADADGAERAVDRAAALLLLLTPDVFESEAVGLLLQRAVHRGKPVLLCHDRAFDFAQPSFASSTPHDVRTEFVPTLFRMQQSIQVPDVYEWADADLRGALVRSLLTRYAKRAKFTLERLGRRHASLTPDALAIDASGGSASRPS